jgi:hypothetical protein
VVKVTTDERVGFDRHHPWAPPMSPKKRGKKRVKRPRATAGDQ